MQKKIIALAVAGLVSGGAFAQANVTVSGQMRVGIDRVEAGGATAAGANLINRTRVVDNNSNIRFSGEEKLSNAMTAWFQIESAIGTSDNVGTSGSQGTGLATSTGIGTRNTAVGLKGGWGSLLIGKWDQHYSSHAGVDGNGLAPHSYAMIANSLDILHTNNGANGAGGRFNNVIQYTTPNMSGFDMNIGYSTSTANEVTTTGARKEGNWLLNPRYTNGPIAAFYSYLRRTDIGNPVTAAPEAKFHRLGGAYTMPMGFKLGLIWDRNEAKSAAGVTTKRDAWALPLSYTMGANNFVFTYAQAGKSSVGGTDVANSDAKMIMLGYGYSLSKRTSIGLSVTQITNSSAATYDGWHPSSSVGAQSATGLPAGSDPRAYSLNVNHTF